MSKIIEAKELRALEKQLRKTDPHWRTTIRLARTARDEAEKMAKKGFLVDKNALQSLVFGGGLADSAEAVRKQVQGASTVVLGNGLTVSADYYLEAKRKVERFNLGVRMFNLYHAKAIKAGTIKKRYEKRFSIGTSPQETQEDVDNWIENVRSNYTSHKGYYGTLRDQYVFNLGRALDSVYPVVLDSTGLKEFIKEQLKSKVPEHFTGSEGERAFNYVYEETLDDFISRLREVAIQFNFVAEYDAFVSNNKLLQSLI